MGYIKESVDIPGSQACLILPWLFLLIRSELRSVNEGRSRFCSILSESWLIMCLWSIALKSLKNYLCHYHSNSRDSASFFSIQLCLSTTVKESFLAGLHLLNICIGFLDLRLDFWLSKVLFFFACHLFCCGVSLSIEFFISSMCCCNNVGILNEL